MFRGRVWAQVGSFALTCWKALRAPLGLIAAVFIFQEIAGFFPQLVERFYSRAVFPSVAGALSFSSLVNFSLGEALLVLVIAALAVWLALLARKILGRREQAGAILVRALSRLLWALGAGLALYMIVFGLNYQRQSLSQTLEFERRDPTAAEIVAISRDVLDNVNRNYAESGANAGAQGGSRLPLSPGELYSALEAAYENEPLLRGASGARVQPKPVYFSGVMSRLGISGIYSPFTGEPNYNALQPDCDLPFAVAHEMAHQRGYAREDEANFIAFLVCTKSSNPYVRYSGYLNALRVLGILARVSPGSFREVVATLGEGPRADLKARAQFWARYSGRLAQFGQSVNNVYLRVNGVRSGVRNYNEASALIVGYYLKQGAAGPAAD
ncbi:MAG TPA: DUF3810 domain-containing protein [Pyrinomonadaceae bacterium]|nr:DUF3810 domain-containing protein [Pyrinomonadaceae bacterium]